MGFTVDKYVLPVLPVGCFIALSCLTVSVFDYLSCCLIGNNYDDDVSYLILTSEVIVVVCVAVVVVVSVVIIAADCLTN